ncbi:MAG TPA: TonB family protein [Bryobacteraceae bacterium]|nr:TonB family protein [Bryobacteraceae bacterium]
MASHVDILDEPERLRRWLFSSVVLHLAVAGGLVAYAVVGGGVHETFGEKNGGGLGSVTVSVVPQIPLPQRSGRPNPVASDTKSVVPTPPPKVKQQPRVKPPEPDAIPLKSRNAQKKPAPAQSNPNKFRAQQHDLPNQLYSDAGTAVVSPMYQMPGGGGVGIGSNSPFGSRLGWYANLLLQQVGRHWNTGDVDARIRTAPAVVVTFTIMRDGSVPPGSVRVVQRSGIPALDFSAQRAVLDASPFPALPSEFTRNQADVEFKFVLVR